MEGQAWVSPTIKGQTINNVLAIGAGLLKGTWVPKNSGEMRILKASGRAQKQRLITPVFYPGLR